jgi:MFS superfamily sulfate permease-like transporter
MKLSFVPGLATLSSYRLRWLRSDVVAGLVLTALLVPQGMAYAELAGLPPITGLYTSILCLVGYTRSSVRPRFWCWVLILRSGR